VPLGSPLEDIHDVLLTLAVTPPDAEGSGVKDALGVSVALKVKEPDVEAQADANALREAQPVELGEGAVERVAEAHAVADLHSVERGVAVALTALVALGVGGATDGDAHEDWRLLREPHGEALGDAQLERVKRGDPLGGPLAELRIVLLTLAVIPDAVEKGDNDTLRVPDAQRVAVLDGDGDALLEGRPDPVKEVVEVLLPQSVALDVKDVDVFSESVRVFGKGRKERVVPVGVPALEAIQRYRQAARVEVGPLFLSKVRKRIFGMVKAVGAASHAETVGSRKGAKARD
jgi:hypothetical protein